MKRTTRLLSFRPHISRIASHLHPSAIHLISIRLVYPICIYPVYVHFVTVRSWCALGAHFSPFTDISDPSSCFFWRGSQLIPCIGGSFASFTKEIKAENLDDSIGLILLISTQKRNISSYQVSAKRPDSSSERPQRSSFGSQSFSLNAA